MQHKPVMLNEIIDFFKPCPSKHILDCTFGRGGHTKQFLRHGASVTAIDRDIDAFHYGSSFVFSRFTIKHCKFSELNTDLKGSFDSILFDFGLSSNQIADTDRGISFKTDGPLDMGMGRNNISAYNLVNFANEKYLADTIYEYGEERLSRQVAKSIVDARKKKRITTTSELAEIVRKVVRGRGIDPATRTFQAIRIYVNNELEEIKMGLTRALRLLKPGGKMAAISFHSLEDRIVKNFFKQFKYRSDVIFPSKKEIFDNKRSRSAKLRFMCAM
jgi:16S rRNA (cytosine1402-N4)-methyltransferase